jgi:hypothetical protein
VADTVKTPYDAAKRLINAADIPNWLNDYDALRLASYELYENIYWTEPGTFRLQQRGSEENPIYIPSGRIITNTMNRYTGKDITFRVDKDYGTDTEKVAILLAFTEFFKRERFASTFNSNKLYGIMRGDWMFYITANAETPQGSRLSLRALDPRMYFPINPSKDVDRIIGCDIVEQVVIGDTVYVNRTRYLKPEHPDHPKTGDYTAPVSYQVDILEQENWEDPNESKIYQTTTPAVLLPAGITNLPVYHIKNFEEPGNPFGSSEMRGIERIMAAVNQSITDEELALALHGLGMYKSEKGQPRDASGNPTPWVLGPGRVVHDGTFDRVNGVTSVSPSLEHIQYLEDRMNETIGASDVARGRVDVAVAESGIALQLRLGPIIETSNQRDTGIREVVDQMLYDLRAWFAGYEGVNFGEARINCDFGRKVPKNIKEEFDMLLSMVSNDPPLMTIAAFLDAARDLGVSIPPDMDPLAIAEERAQFMELADPLGARLNDEANGADSTASDPTEDVVTE